MHRTRAERTGSLLSRLAGALFCALASGLCSEPICAQAPIPSAKPTAPTEPSKRAGREIVVQNLAPFGRSQIASVVVPFAQGIAGEPPELSIDDRPTVWQPFGARWPDGTWRQAICLFPVDLGPLSEVRLPLVAGARKPAAGEIKMPEAVHKDVSLSVSVRRGQRAVRAEPQRVRDLESNAMRRVELRRCRVDDSGLVVELIVTAYRDQPHADVSVSIWFSDPGSPDMQRKVDELAIECRGMALVLRHAGYLGIEQSQTPYGSRTVLLRNAVLGDAQGIRRTGALVPPLPGKKKVDDTLRAVATAPLLAATSWRNTDAFGPYGVVPPPPPWLAGDALRLHFSRRHRAFVKRERPGGDPFGVGPFGQARFAGQTGDQADFGTCKLAGIAWSGMPSMLLEVEPSVLQEACRPVHFFEQDGSPVEPDDHPEWVVWSGRTHWHGGVSKDRLGKPVPQPPSETHGWTGKDREHWSNNHLAAYALLTGAHWARRELENDVRLYLAGQTLDPSYSTSNAGAPRGGGRTALSASWALCVLGDNRLRERMDQRMDRVYFQQWRGRELAADRVRPMAVTGPDNRLLRGKHPFWNPWQDALAAVGFGAHHRMTGNQKARQLAEQLACNVVRHGWRCDDAVCEVGMAIRWLEGEPFSPAQWRSTDDTLVQWGFETAFSEWSIAAVEIARVVAERDGDHELADKARSIQARMRQGRQKPGAEYPLLGGYDRLSEWDAVQWHAAKN
ncbi:MAG: hypothetical protein AB8H80_06985 [Planctomycetota bacterium]